LIKSSRKGKQEWEKACVESGMWHYKQKILVVQTKFANKMIIFKGDVRVQKGYYFMLWVVEDNVLTTNPQGWSVGNCTCNHKYLKPCHHMSRDELVKGSYY